MDFQEAKELLLLHSFGHPDINHPKMERGFLGSLRPYRGLNDENFHEVMQALISLAPHFQHESRVDKEIISALWTICELGRAWGIHRDGMLRRNNLITTKEVTRLEHWIETISYAVFVLLDGGDLETALEPYPQKPG